MELQGERLIPVSQDKTWAALNDPQILKACISGCESLERAGDDAFAAVVAVKVGPVSARFKGKLKLVDVQAPNSYTLNFDGQGGVAGFAKGTADVTLAGEADGQATRSQGDRRLLQGPRRPVGAAAADRRRHRPGAAAGRHAEGQPRAVVGHCGAGRGAVVVLVGSLTRPAL